MVMFDNNPRVTVDRLLVDAAEDRARGCRSSDVDVLREHLGEALAREAQAEKKADAASDLKDERVSELEAEADCGIAAADRKAGKPCDGDDCTACRLIWAAMEKDCKATDERRTAGLCAASHLGVDRCCECAAHLLKIETDGAMFDRDAEIERLTKELDSARGPTPSKSADVIAQLRTDLALAEARHGAAIERATGLLAHAIAERDAAVIQADTRPAPPVKVKPAKAHDGPSLFDYLQPAEPAAAPVKAKRPKGAGRNVKKYTVAK